MRLQLSAGAWSVQALRVRATALVKGETSIVTASFMLGNIIRVLSTVVLTRLLAPEAFGAIGLVTSVMVVFQMMSDIGYGAFVIRHPKADDPEFRHTIWTIRLCRSVLLSALMFAASGILADLLGKPELTDLLRLFSVYFVLEALASISLVIAIRERKLVKMSIVELSGAVIQLVGSIVLAIFLKSYWAIAIAMLFSYASRIAFSYLMFDNSRPSFRFNRGYARELFNFAKIIIPSSAITLLLSQSDRIVLSRIFPLDVFGLYMIAVNLTSVPTGFANGYAARLLYPRYSGMWHHRPDNLSDYYYSTKRWLSVLYALGVGGLIGIAPMIIEIMYDDRYEDSAIYLRILLIAPLFLLSTLSANSVLTASGRVEATLAANIVRLSWLLAAGPPAFYFFGPLGLIAAFATVEAAALVYQWTQLARYRLLAMREELLLIMLSGGGAAVGFALTALLLPILQSFR